jgi:alpha-glucosidase (family GH31 glycosyl hydrolase)
MIRNAIKRRYELIPYTYSQMLKSHITAVPPQRWTGWGYESDPEVWTKAITQSDTQYWFGDALLIAGVYEPGKTSAKVYLPKKGEDEDEPGFLNVNTPYQHLVSGKWHEIVSTWQTSIPVLARCGSAVPVGKNRPTSCLAEDKDEQQEFPNMEKDDWRGVEIYPPPVSRYADMKSTTFRSTWLEDDGISSEAKADLFEVTISYTVGEDAIDVEVHTSKRGKWEPLWLPHGVDIILPVGEQRDVKTAGAGKAEDKGRDSKGRRIWGVSIMP